MARIRVVHVTVGLQWGGAEKLLADIAACLDKNRFDVQVISLKEDGPVGEHLRKAGIPVHCLNSTPATLPFLSSRFQRLIRAAQPDIVHAHLLYANLAAAFCKGPYRLIWHDHCMDDWMGPVLRFLEGKFIGRGDLLAVGSQRLKDRFHERMPNLSVPIEIISNGVDMKQFRALPPDQFAEGRKEFLGCGPEVPVVGYIGRLDEPIKGLSVLIRSVPHLRELCPMVQVFLVGGGKDRAMLETLARQTGVADVVHFKGPQPTVDKIYPLFDVFVLPSYSEGSSISLMEAMSSGRPVVSTRVGGTPEIVSDGETGKLVPSGEPQILADALVSLLNDSAAARSMGDKGRARAEKLFDVDKNVAALELVYEKMMKDSPADR